MPRFLATPFFRLTALGTAMVAIILSVSVAHGQTAAPAPTVTSVNVVSTTGTKAVISFTYSAAPANGSLQYKVKYGPNPAPGQPQAYPSDTGWAATTGGSALATLTGLNPSTTYHFLITLQDGQSPAQSTTTVDRSFATQSTTGDASNLTIDNIRADCIDTRCQVNFSTSRKAQVELRWDAAARSGFADYQYSVAETDFRDVFRSLAVPGSGQPTLTASTTYHYAMRATDENGYVFTTADLSMNTSANSTDHTFSTGSCEGGVAIGTCSADRRLCTAGGRLVTDCTSVCGYVCPAQTTCGTGGQCFVDPPLSGAPSQCNQSRCYGADGQLIKPAPAGCYASWPKCNANAILKVRKDRGCNLWLSCATSIQTEASSAGPAENLCLSLAACNSLSSNGQCNRYLPPGQCSNDPLRFCGNDGDCTAGGTCNLPTAESPNRSLRDLTFTAPDQVGSVANLSGNVIAGLDWNQQGGANVIQGNLPWQLMQQIGGNSQLTDGDFEYSDLNFKDWWKTVPDATPSDAIRVDFENKDAGPNHILIVQPVTSVGICQDTTVPTNLQIGKNCEDDNGCRPVGNASGTCAPTPVTFSGAASEAFRATPSEFYYAEARIKSDEESPRVRMQLGFDNYTRFTITNADGSTTPTFVDVTATSAWQRVTLGPLKGLSGQTRVAFVCSDSSTCGQFEVDDVQVRPVLQTTSNPTYLTPSCRLYPKDSAPSCDYQDTNGTIFKGWRGYCLERDSQTGTCLSWWPVDIIKGESSLFSTTAAGGYQDRAPLYLCAETDARKFDEFFDHPTLAVTAPYTISEKYFTRNVDPGIGNCNVIGSDCTRSNELFVDRAYTIAQCNDHTSRGASCEVISARSANQLTESDIGRVVWKLSSNPYDLTTVDTEITIVNSSAFQASDVNSPPVPSRDGQFEFTTYRDTSDPNFIFWWRKMKCIPGCTDRANNAVSVGLKFSKATGKFVSYILDFVYAQGTGGEAGVGYQVVFYRQPACSKLIQVVTSTGDNSAFAGRINSTKYKVPDLNYKQTTDLSPYGGALAPVNNGTDSPDRWPTKVYVQQPNYLQSSASGQARAGTPYACNGQCSDVVCTVDGSSCLTNGTLDQTLVLKCQNKDIDQDGVPDGQCVGLANDASQRDSQSFSAAHDPTAVSPSSGTVFPYYAQERIRRLFAQSFGIWSTLRCSNNESLVCNADADCGGSATCSKIATSYRAVNTATAQNWNPPTAICPEQQQPGVCSASPAQCSTSTTGRVTGVSSTCLLGCVQATMDQEAINDGIARCKQTAACDGTNSACPGTGTAVKFTGGTGDPTTCQTVPAAPPQVGTTRQCTVNCSLSTATAYQQSALLQAAETRPTRPDFPNDYCAVPPRLTCPISSCQPGQLAAFLSGSSKELTISGGSGNVGITLKPAVDVEQAPLKSVNIDWGDGKVEPFPAQKPFIYSHVYILNRADTSRCTSTNGRFTCDFKIKAQVQDNWGWCSNNSHGSACPGDSSTWQDTGLSVRLEP